MALLRRTSLAVIILGIAVYALMVPIADAAGPPTKDIALLGVVTKIFQAGNSPPFLRGWGATIQVERVVAGEYPHSTFTFTLHSPSRAGLKTGHRYIIKARAVGEGYLVDEPGGIENADGKRRS